MYSFFFEFFEFKKFKKKYVFTFFLNFLNSKNSKNSKKKMKVPKRKKWNSKNSKNSKKNMYSFFLIFLNSISFFLVYRLTSRDSPERGIISIKSFRHANVQIVHKGPSYIYIYIHCITPHWTNPNGGYHWMPVEVGHLADDKRTNEF